MANYFEGISELTVDSKGRFAVPVRHREDLIERCGGRLKITIDPVQRCLVIYPMDEWEKIRPVLISLSSLNPAQARVKRAILGNASDMEMDKGGRLLIPPKHRKHAAFEKKIVLVGQGNKFELWNEQHWDELIDALPEIALQEGDIPDVLESIGL